jgi:hypothetical protein
LGFIAKYNAPHYVEISGPRFPHYYYVESQDNFAYLRLGIDVQTRGKIAFIAKGHIFQALTYNATGFDAQIGVKYAITPKLAISLGPEMVNYSGNVGGWYKKTREYDHLNPQNTFSDINIKGKHYSGASLYSLKLGVHFL